MVEFEIYSFEINTNEQVSAPGVAEAMLKYLPWDTLDVKIKLNPSSGIYEVIDNQTDFLYKVTPVKKVK